MAGILSDYQSLLAAEESISSLNAAILLTQRIARGGRKGDRNIWNKLLRWLNSSDQRPASSQYTQMIRQVVPILSRLPIVARQAEVEDGQYSLLMDTLLIVFHQAYFVLLPKSTGERMPLIRAFAAFAELLPNPADQFQVHGLVALELGRSERALNCFRSALAATHSDQHDFLTRVQMLWSQLMEIGDISGAFSCLQDVAPRVTRIDYDEFQGLLAATFAEAQRRPRVARKPAGP